MKLLTKKPSVKRGYQSYSVAGVAMVDAKKHFSELFDEDSGYFLVKKDESEKEFISFFSNLEDEIVKLSVDRTITQLETITHGDEQGGTEWLRNRGMYFTSTSMPLYATGLLTAGYKKEVARVVARRFLDMISPYHPVSIEVKNMDSMGAISLMRRGSALESEAIVRYTEEKGVEVVSRGLVIEKDGVLGDSIDGIAKYADGDIGIEVKCPKIEKYFYDELHKDYHTQIQQHLYLHKLDFVDFVVYFPNMPLRVTRIGRDYNYLDKLVEAEKLLREEVNTKLAEFI